MEFNFIPAIVFVIVTTFTPGPNNIISTSLGLMHGYKRSVPFLIGIVSGYFVIMISASFLSLLLYEYLPSFAPYLRIVGALYIAWLAYSVFKNSRIQKNNDEIKPLGFKNGFFLQFVNPKGIFCSLTVYSTFLTPVLKQTITIISLSLLFSLFCFVSVTIWSLTGSYIRRYLHTELRMKIFSSILALALLYTAIDLLN